VSGLQAKPERLGGRTATAHQYGLPIQVEHGPDGAPTAFTWRGERFDVLQVLSEWHLRDRWWVSPVAVALGHEAKGPSDRAYYRVLVPDQQVVELCYDQVSNVWVLDVIWD
jgi:hypothetical protein